MGLNWSLMQTNRNPKTVLDWARPEAHGRVYEPLPEIPRDVLIRVLNNIARYMSSRCCDLRIVAYGGIVNTLYFKSSAATRDVGFFNEKWEPRTLGFFILAVREAVRQDSFLQEQWFYNRPVYFFPTDLHAGGKPEVTEQAERQGIVIFRQPGLTVLAPPWDFALCSKLGRTAPWTNFGDQIPRYDCRDAIVFLRAYLQQRGQSHITNAELRACESIPR